MNPLAWTHDQWNMKKYNISINLENIKFSFTCRGRQNVPRGIWNKNINFGWIWMVRYKIDYNNI